MPPTRSPDGIQSAVFGSLNQTGLTAAGEIAETGMNVTPPDSTGAIGPNDYVETVNSEIAAYSRSSLALDSGSPVSIEHFSGGVETCDPQIKYDPEGGRWFYVTIRCDLGGKTLYMGFSKSSDPTDLSTGAGGGWCGYEYDTGEAFEDYPKLGLDPQHIIIGANSYEATGEEAFLTAHIISAPKPSAGTIESCPAAPALSVFGSTAKPLMTSLGHQAFTPEPATVADSSTAGYVVAADFEDAEFTRGKDIMIWEVGGTAAEPHLVPLGAAAVSSYEIPPSVPQPHSNRTIDSLDARLTQAVAAADPNAGEEAVWTQHTVAGGAGSVVRWYELLPAQLGKGAAVRQEGTISDTSKYVFNAAIAPTLSGAAVINYNTGSASADVQIAAQSRDGSAPLGTMGAATVLGSSESTDSDFTCQEEACRWGDYAGASVDPVNENLVWGSNQLNGTGERNHAQWITRNFALMVGKTQTITFTSTPPSSASVGGPSYTVSASASSGLPVSFSSASPAVCSVSGSLVSFIGAGECVVNADQAGNSEYEPAPTQQQNITVAKGSQAITFTSSPPTGATVGGPTYNVSATGGASGNPVTFTIDSASSSVCSISGATVSFIGGGTCTIDANQAGNANYEAAPQAQQSVIVAPAPSAGSGAGAPSSSPTPNGATPSTSPLTAPLAPLLAPDSNFKLLGVKVNRLTGALTFSVSIHDPGRLSFLLTFQNGRFGVVAARAARCRPGQLWLRGRCRRSRITYAAGSRTAAAPGLMTFTVKPARAGLTALRQAAKRQRALPVVARLSFQSSLGGPAVSHSRSLHVRLRSRARG